MWFCTGPNLSSFSRQVWEVLPSLTRLTRLNYVTDIVDSFDTAWLPMLLERYPQVAASALRRVWLSPYLGRKFERCSNAWQRPWVPPGALPNVALAAPRLICFLHSA